MWTKKGCQCIKRDVVLCTITSPTNWTFIGNFIDTIDIFVPNGLYLLYWHRDPCHPRCRGLMLLETFTTLPISQLRANLPPFLAITEEVTGDPAFSMYNLALRSEWTDNTKDFCHSLRLPEEVRRESFLDLDGILQAHERLRTLHSDGSSSDFGSSDDDLN